MLQGELLLPLIVQHGFWPERYTIPFLMDPGLNGSRKQKSGTAINGCGLCGKKSGKDDDLC